MTKVKYLASLSKQKEKTITMTNEQIRQAYDDNFTDEEIQDIRNEYDSVKRSLNYCEACEEIVDNSKVSAGYHTYCDCMTDWPTFEEWVKHDSTETKKTIIKYAIKNLVNSGLINRSFIARELGMSKQNFAHVIKYPNEDLVNKINSVLNCHKIVIKNYIS